MELNTTSQITPGILTMLPLFYVGWSDSVLSPSEIKLIHEKLEDADFLTDYEKEYLIHYTDPQTPPTTEVFKFWVDTLKEKAYNLEELKKKSLVDLGIEMALSSIEYDKEKPWNAPKAVASIKEIEKAMGLESESSVHLFLGKMEHDSNKEDSIDEFSFESKKMQSILDGDKADVIERVKKLMRDPFFSIDLNPDKSVKRNRTLKQVKALAKQGLGSYAFPKNFGGGGRVGDHITVFETLAYGDLSLLIKFGVQFGLFGGTVFNLGTEKHHRKYIDPLGKADLLGCFAMTETGHGSNVRGLETTAVYDHEKKSITIHSPTHQSGKEYIGNAMHCSMAAVFAQLIVNGEKHGVHAVLVPIRDQESNLYPGIKVEDCGYKIGLNGVDNGRLWFDQVEVPVENLLDRFGSIDEDGHYISSIQNPNKRFFTMLGALVVGRICVGQAGINASKSALAIAIKYGNKRRQFASKDDEPETLLMDYPTHQRRLLPRLAKTYGYYLSIAKLSKDYIKADEDKMRKIETKAAGLKALATWHATDTIQECREACGGKGYLSENRIGALKADSDIFTTFEGDNTVLLQLVAKGLLTEFKQSFHDEGFTAVIRYLGDRIGNTLNTYNPIYKRNTSSEHLLDREFHLDAFRYREKRLLISLSQRMQDYLKKRINPFDAFLKCQTHMIELAKAYIERLVLRDFNSKIRELDDGKEKKALSKMCDLYALSVIEEHKGWYLESDYMDGSKTKAVRRMVTKLCAGIKLDSLAYVDAFGIPDDLLGAEII
ncbi:MAG: acyl-CoA dehydrogenase [Saprospiraceae bacterium]|nr:acyl-CoA dehydrogenase [Saprospiraceae bacterium]